MTPEDILGLARRGDLDALARDREAVAESVRAFVRERDAASALELASRTWRLWFSRGELDEASAVLSTALAASSPTRVRMWRARALYADGVVAFRLGDQKRSLARNEEALAVARATDDIRGECDALTGLARVALRDGRYDHVVNLAGQARERAQAVGDREAEAAPLHLQAAGVRLQQDYVGARDLYVQSLDLNAALEDADWVAIEQHNLGWVALHLDNVAEAETRFHEVDEHTGQDAYVQAWSSLNWAAVALARGDRAEAQRRFAEGTEALHQLGVALDPDDQSELDWLCERLRTDTP